MKCFWLLVRHNFEHVQKVKCSMKVKRRAESISQLHILCLPVTCYCGLKKDCGSGLPGPSLAMQAHVSVHPLTVQPEKLAIKKKKANRKFFA